MKTNTTTHKFTWSSFCFGIAATCVGIGVWNHFADGPEAAFFGVAFITGFILSLLRL